MKLQHPKPHNSVRRALRSWAGPLAIALVMIIGLETAATAAFLVSRNIPLFITANAPVTGTMTVGTKQTIVRWLRTLVD